MLRKWFKNQIIRQAILFAMRQLSKFQENTDWNKVKQDLEPRIRDLVPFEFFDDTAVEWANAFIDMVASVLSAQAELQEIVTLLSQSKFDEAWEKLRDLILDQFQPSTVTQQFVYDCVDDCKELA